MTLLVDTSVWSLALRRDAPPDVPQVGALRHALHGAGPVVTTGLVLQEFLQGLMPAKVRSVILERLEPLAFIQPSRSDHVAAADLRTTCRQSGVQIGTIDALIAALCIRHGLVLLSADRDFEAVERHSDLVLWQAPK